MAQHFYPIRLKDIRKTTKGCAVLTFDITDELRDTFNYTQGQYLTLKAEVNGEEIRRSYSLCSSPLDNEWKVAVKKIENGKFSTFVNEVLQAGDVIELMPPNGRFFCQISGEKKNYVAFAAGSGITPIHSIIKTHLKEEPSSTFRLFYFNQTIQSIILKEEIEGLKNQFLDRFELYHFLTQQERDAPLFNGRIDNEKLKKITDLLFDINSIDEFFICGPNDMIFLIRDYLIERNINEKKIHFELFNTPGNTKTRNKVDILNTDKSRVAIINNGMKITFEMTQGENILDAALRKNADLPFACKGGVCCTCKAKLMKGEVEMEVNYALEKEEVEAGFILTCQSIPKTDELIIDFDC